MRDSSFAMIPNAQIDANKKQICASLRENAAHYIYSIYRFKKGEFVLESELHELYAAVDLPYLYDAPVDFSLPIDEQHPIYVEVRYKNGKKSVSKPSYKAKSEYKRF